MRYIIAIAIVFAAIFGLMSLSLPVGATMTVSGESRVITQNKKKPDLKATYTLQKRQILAKIAKVKLDIAELNSQIDYVQKKMDSRTKAGLDTTAVQKKLVVLTAAKKKAEDNLANLKKKLAETEALLSK